MTARQPFLAAGLRLGIDSTYLGNDIELSDNGAADVNSNMWPAMTRRLTWLDHIEVTGTITAGNPISLFAFLSYDAAGDFPASGEAQVSVRTGVTTPTEFGANIPGGAFLQQSANSADWSKMYLQIRTNAGTVDAVARAIGYLE